MRVALSLLAAMALAGPASAAGSGQQTMPMMEEGHHSAFTDYRPYRQTEMASWREANDMSLGQGGHAGHNMMSGGMRDRGAGMDGDALPAPRGNGGGR